MKTALEQIKIVALGVFLILSIGANAQKEVKKDNVFLRVYNLEGKKISKGPIVLINDSLIVLKNNSGKAKISWKEIGFIKTKRSAGNNVLIGAVAGVVVGGAIGASTADPNDWFLPINATEGGLIGGFFGGLGGGAIGAATSLLKKSETYIISGSEVNWQSFKKVIGE